MKTTFRFRRAAQLLALALAAAGLAEAGMAADLRQRLNVRQEASEVVLGEVMNAYYMGNSFAAMNHLLVAKAMGRIDARATTSELLLGDLYTAFGMPEEANNVFAYLGTRDIRTQTRNETVFRQGRLQYRQGNYFEAERILSTPLDTQLSQLETERRVMLANVLMTRNAYAEARAALLPIPLDHPLGAYATYNSGVSHLRTNQAAQGKQLLEQVMNLPVSETPETNALKDRAALALGYGYLQLQQPEKARDALVNVRLKGPFSNNAMLALGWANYERKDYKRALAYWLELLTRNSADRFVQEALLLAPRAYEALQANQQALYGYKLAAATLTSQLETIEKLESDIKGNGWLDRLNARAEADRFADPMAPSGTAIAGDAMTTAQLYSLFTSHPFNEAYQQYEQLKRLRTVLDQRSGDLRALRDSAAFMRRRQAELPGLAGRVDSVQGRLGQVADRFPLLDKRARQSARANAGAARAPVGLKTMEQQFKLQQVETKLAKLPDNAATRALRERVRVLKGLILMDNASKIPVSEEQIYADLGAAERQLRLLQLRMEAVQQLLADNQKIAGDTPEARINAMESRLQSAYQSLDRALDEYRRYLNQLAYNQVEDSRNRINSDIAEAHLSIARLQDASLLRDDRQAALPEKPMP
ncbi:MAG: tetratricopeptide repeat protein [Pseudomonadota bacterium]